MIELNKFNITEAIDNDFWKQSASNDVFYLKELPYEEKRSFLIYALDSKGLKNSNVIINISLLIKQGIDETLFERKDIYFNSLMELIDLKIDMKQQLDDLRKKLVKYYFGVVKSIIVKNEEQSVHLDNLYYYLLHILSINDISLMMQKINNIEDIPFICNAKEIYKNIINNSLEFHD